MYHKFVRHDFVPTLRACIQIRFSEASTAAFGNNGYRADCRNIPFQEVLVVNEQGRQAWFKQKASTPSTFRLSSTDYFTVGAAFGLWTGYGVANAGYDYQFGVCDAPNNFSPGLFFSGYMPVNGVGASCYKACNNWCSDGSSMYFRTSSGMPGYLGVAFAQNGHGEVAYQTVSYGIRAIVAPTTAYSSCAEILANNPTAGDGLYWIKPVSANPPFRIFCEYVQWSIHPCYHSFTLGCIAA
jgi:hypothetical protein